MVMMIVLRLIVFCVSFVVLSRKESDRHCFMPFIIDFGKGKVPWPKPHPHVRWSHVRQAFLYVYSRGDRQTIGTQMILL